MSRILKNRKILAVCILTSILLLIIFSPLWYLSFVLLGIFVPYALNYILIKRNLKVISIFHQREKIVKIDTLIIGDTCTEKLIKQYARGNTLRIQHPERSLEASYQIFMHVESILEENGKLIVINDSKVKQQFSIFDIPFIHTISRKELGIEHLAKKTTYPLIYETIKSFKILIGYMKTGYSVVECPQRELVMFCKKRGIDLIYLSK